jgi:hypothetical protein
VVRKGSPDWKELDRHFIRTTVVADKLADTYLGLWQTDPDAIDIRCPIGAIDVEPGDVVNVTVPNLGMNSRPFLVVDNTLVCADDKVKLVLYDIENTL